MIAAGLVVTIAPQSGAQTGDVIESKLRSRDALEICAGHDQPYGRVVERGADIYPPNGSGHTSMATIGVVSCQDRTAYKLIITSVNGGCMTEFAKGTGMLRYCDVPLVLGSNQIGVLVQEADGGRYLTQYFVDVFERKEPLPDSKYRENWVLDDFKRIEER